LELKDYLTIGLGLAGVLLSAFTLWKTQFHDKKIKLKVVPKVGWRDRNAFVSASLKVDPAARPYRGRGVFCVEVINESSFPVLVSGVCIIDRTWRPRKRQWIVPDFPTPFKLEPMEAKIVSASAVPIDHILRDSGGVQVETTNDKVFRVGIPGRKKWLAAFNTTSGRQGLGQEP